MTNTDYKTLGDKADSLKRYAANTRQAAANQRGHYPKFDRICKAIEADAVAKGIQMVLSYLENNPVPLNNALFDIGNKNFYTDLRILLPDSN